MSGEKPGYPDQLYINPTKLQKVVDFHQIPNEKVRNLSPSLRREVCQIIAKPVKLSVYGLFDFWGCLILSRFAPFYSVSSERNSIPKSKCDTCAPKSVQTRAGHLFLFDTGIAGVGAIAQIHHL
jgi:hypothetical protein